MLRMTQLNSYLTFGGNCREAMTFYKKCLGGELTLQTIGESTLIHKMPKAMREYIVHATLTTTGFVLMGTDLMPETGLQKGNSVSLVLHCKNEGDIRMYFDNLANGGTVNQPLKTTYFGSLFADLTDRFGNNWLLNYEQINKSH